MMKNFRQTAVATVTAVILGMAALTSAADSFNGSLSYSSTLARGKWTSSFSKALSAAKQENVPLVAIWVSSGCGFCKSFAANLSWMSSSWMKSRNYYFVIGVDSRGEGGDVKDFVRNSSGKYPYCCVYWKKNSEGKTVQAKFSGREGNMAMDESTFRSKVDKYTEAGAYANTYTLTVTSNKTNCKVSGGGRYKKGKTAKLKSSAAKDYVLSGWYQSGKTLLSQKPTYSYTMPGASTSITGSFIKKTDDKATLSYSLAKEYARGKTMKSASVKATGKSLPSVSFSGLPKGMKYASTAISGKPSKSGVYKVIGKVKTAGGKVAFQTNSVVVRASGEYVVRVEVDAASAGHGSVSGSKVLKKGKTMTLTAKPKSGYVFVGWFDDDKAKTLKTRSKTYKYKVEARDVTFKAKFATKQEDRAAVGVTLARTGSDKVDSLRESEPLARTVTRGVKVSWPVVRTAISSNSISVKGLPSGLSFKKNSAGVWVITGVPTAASSVDSRTKLRKPSSVKITVKTAGNTVTYRLALTVEPQPSWAYGNFYGHASLSGIVGTASMTVSSKGKVSCKYKLNGSTWTFSSSGYASDNGAANIAERVFTIEATAKCGKSSRKMSVKVKPGWIAENGTDLLSHSFAAGEDEVKTQLDLRRYAWGDKGAAKYFIAGTYALSDGLQGVKAKVSKTGDVTFSGKLNGVKISSSAKVRLGTDGACTVNLVVPTTKTLSGGVWNIPIPTRE